jgi:hypothetical protein
MLRGALLTDLHLYNEAVGFMQHSRPKSGDVLATDAVHSAAAQETTVRGRSCAQNRSLEPDIKDPSSATIKSTTDPADRRDQPQQAAQRCQCE